MVLPLLAAAGPLMGMAGGMLGGGAPAAGAAPAAPAAPSGPSASTDSTSTTTSTVRIKQDQSDNRMVTETGGYAVGARGRFIQTVNNYQQSGSEDGMGLSASTSGAGARVVGGGFTGGGARIAGMSPMMLAAGAAAVLLVVVVMMRKG